MVIGPVQFDSPLWLLLAPLTWTIVWMIGRRSLTGLGAATRRTALGVRFIVLGLIASALAEPQWRRKSEDVAVLIIADTSKSMPPGSQAQLLDYLDQAASTRRPHDRIGLTTAAEDGRVRLIPGVEGSSGITIRRAFEFGALDATDRDGTDLASATKLSLAVAPDDAASRLLLFSDGNETVGSLLAAAEEARARGIPIDVLPTPYTIEREVIFDALIAPLTGRKGQNVDLRFVLTSTRPSTGRLSLFGNGRQFDLAPGDPSLSAHIQLEEGQNVIPAPITLTSGGPQRFQAIFEPDDPDADTLLQNNSALAVTFVSTEGRILVYTEDETSVADFAEALRDAMLDVELRAPSSGHTSLVELQPYDAVVLFDVAAYSFSGRQLKELQSYVHDVGGGLVMVGGPSSYGAGGWIGTPVAEALPVRLDPPQKRNIPRGALVLIMHSVEMPQGTYWGKQVAHAAAGRLSRLDLIGVLEFVGWGGAGNGVGWAYPLQERGDGAAVTHAINNLRFGDMPDFDATMQAAHTALAGASASQKHCIIISDGDPSGPARSLLQKFITDKISISTVAMSTHGIQQDMRKMLGIAQDTGGNYYQVNSNNDMAKLPEIFIKEAQSVKRALIWEGDPFSPTIANSAAQPMRGIRSLPPISGYIVTTDREGLATVTVRGLNDDPLVAQWQHGLGRAIAFTSDATARWASSWLTWGQFQAFWDQHLRWVMRPTGSANVRIATIDRGDEAGVIVSALTSDGEPLNFARFAGRVILPDLNARELKLSQTGPGRYEGSFQTTDPGSYLLNLQYESPGRAGGEAERGNVQAAVTRPFASEHKALKDNLGLLQQVADLTGGRLLTWDPAQDQIFRREGLRMPVALTPIWLLMTLVALGAFLVDVGVRRVRIDVHAMVRTVRRIAFRTERRSEQQLDALKAARASTRRKLAEQGSGEAVQHTFEADEEYLKSGRTVPLSTAQQADSPAQDKRRAAPATEEGHEEEEGGMSRLIRAKQRARKSMEETDDTRREEQE